MKKSRKENIEAEKPVSEGKKLIALKTTSILAGKKTFKLTEGECVPSDLSDALIESLKNSKLIK